MHIMAKESQQCCVETSFATIKIRVDVQFGDPKKKCAGSGICNIKLANGQAYKKQCSTATAYISVTAPNSIDVRFIKASMLECTKDQYFGDQKFLMEAEYELSDTITQKLQLPVGYIQKGIYSIKETQNCYIIRPTI